jgi:integration host factor subunit beta
MTKSDLIDLLCEAEKMPKGRAELLINAIFDCMEASLRQGERIEIRGFGSFEIRNYRAYEGRNPRTGSAVSVRPKRLPFFKVGKELKERVNAAAGRAITGKDPSNGPTKKSGADGGSPSAPSANGASAEAPAQTAGGSPTSSGTQGTPAKATSPAALHRAASV